MPRRKHGINLTSRDTELLQVLTLRIRILSLAQIGRVWWPDAATPAIAPMRRLQQLQADGYVELVSVMAHPETELSRPLVTWQPGLPPPDQGALAYRLRTRWNEPLVDTPCVIATAFAGRFFGGYGGRKPRRAETTHDLHLSAVFLQMQTNHPERAATWISEEGRKKDLEHGEKLPDAIVTDGDHLTVIELGGKSYDRPKLEAFHDHCAGRNLAYEVW